MTFSSLSTLSGFFKDLKCVLKMGSVHFRSDLVTLDLASNSLTCYFKREIKKEGLYCAELGIDKSEFTTTTCSK